MRRLGQLKSKGLEMQTVLQRFDHEQGMKARATQAAMFFLANN